MTITQAKPTAGPRECGECTFCCKVLEIDELAKPAGQWCKHCAPGRGCKIYDSRPKVCRGYQCTWSLNNILDETWRPDRAKFLMESNERELIIVPDPSMPNGWRKEPYYAHFKRLSARSDHQPFTIVLVRIRERTLVLFPEGEVDLGATPQPGMRIDSGYEMRAGKRVPYARFFLPSAPLPQS